MSHHDLLKHLSVVPDPRVDRNKRHDLSEMLFVAVCATISGAEGWSDIVEFAENRLGLAAAIRAAGERHSG